nr:hypothetical protein [Candidatus Sigynarchaeota archaeon]
MLIRGQVLGQTLLGVYRASRFDETLTQGGLGEMAAGKELEGVARDNNWDLEWHRRFTSTFAGSRYSDFLLWNRRVTTTNDPTMPFEWGDVSVIGADGKTGDITSATNQPGYIQDYFTSMIGAAHEWHNPTALPSYAGLAFYQSYVKPKDMDRVIDVFTNGKISNDRIKWSEVTNPATGQKEWVGLYRASEAGLNQGSYHVLFKIVYDPNGAAPFGTPVSNRMVTFGIRSSPEYLSFKVYAKIGVLAGPITTPSEISQLEARDLDAWVPGSVWYNSFDDTGFKWSDRNYHTQMAPSSMWFNQLQLDGIWYTNIEWAKAAERIARELDNVEKFLEEPTRLNWKRWLKESPAWIREIYANPHHLGIKLEKNAVQEGMFADGFVVKAILDAIGAETGIAVVDPEFAKILLGKFLGKGVDVSSLFMRSKQFGVVEAAIRCSALSPKAKQGFELQVLAASMKSISDLQEVIDSKFCGPAMEYCNRMADRFLGSEFDKLLQSASSSGWSADVKQRVIWYLRWSYFWLYNRLPLNSRTPLPTPTAFDALFVSIGSSLVAGADLVYPRGSNYEGKLTDQGRNLLSEIRDILAKQVFPKDTVSMSSLRDARGRVIQSFANYLIRAMAGGWPTGAPAARNTWMLHHMVRSDAEAVFGAIQFRAYALLNGFKILGSQRWMSPSGRMWQYFRIRIETPSGLAREFIGRIDPAQDIFSGTAVNPNVQFYVVPGTSVPGEWVCSWQPSGKSEEDARNELWAVIRGGALPTGFGSLDNVQGHPPVPWLLNAASGSQDSIIGLLPE